MKLLFTLMPFLFLLSARTCDQKVVEDDGPIFSLGETLNLAYQQKISLKKEGLSLTYKSIKDSRCPEGTQCIRAGEAIIEIIVEKNGKEEMTALEAKGLCMDTSGKCGNSNTAMGYKIQLLSADPYPQNNGKAPVESSSIRVIVTSI